jgi:uncharacterized protein YbjQ (UPF0145 family)
MYDILFFLLLIIIGYIFGTVIEKRHFKDLKKREEEMLYLPTIALKKPLDEATIKKSLLVNGSVVISIDFFKKFVAGLINFFGGNITVYETLIDRARREALLRMKESAKDASEIINVKIETSAITKNTKRVGAVEVFVYATAIYR